MSLPASSANTLRAGAYMLGAMGCFVTNDTLVKSLGGAVPVGELVAIRGAIATVLILFICRWQGVLGGITNIFSKHVFIRAMLDLMGTLLFITALRHMPIANLTSILQAVPLVVALFAAIFLKERVGLRRAAAIMAGLTGVILIVKPSPSTFTIYEALALTIVFSLAVRDIITRRIPARVPSLIVALANAIFVTAGGLALGFYEGMPAPTTAQVATIGVAAAFLALGYVFMVLTLRAGELSATAPFRYSIVVFAIISGVFVFNEIPDGWAILGIVLIVVSGLYAAHREAKLSRIARMSTPSAG